MCRCYNTDYKSSEPLKTLVVLCYVNYTPNSMGGSSSFRSGSSSFGLMPTVFIVCVVITLWSLLLSWPYLDGLQPYCALSLSTSPCLSLSLTVCLSISRSVCVSLSVYLLASVCLTLYLSLFLSTWSLSVCLSLSLSIPPRLRPQPHDFSLPDKDNKNYISHAPYRSLH